MTRELFMKKLVLLVLFKKRKQCRIVISRAAGSIRDRNISKVCQAARTVRADFDALSNKLARCGSTAKRSQAVTKLRNFEDSWLKQWLVFGRGTEISQSCSKLTRIY